MWFLYESYSNIGLSLDQLIIRHPNATFIGLASGQSMKGVGIFDGDILIVDRSLTVKNGDVIFIPDHTNGNLMKCLDNVNHRYGDGTLKVATEGHHEKWQMRREFLSPQYTSQWRDIPKIQC